LDTRSPHTPRTAGQRDEPAADEVLQRIVPVDTGEPGDRPSPPGDEDLGALLDALEMLAETVVKLPHADLVLIVM
jgi:hypothetical protein